MTDDTLVELRKPRYVTIAIFLCMVTFTSAHSLLTQGSKVDDEIQYSFISVSLFAELLKLIICACIVYKQRLSSDEQYHRLELSCSEESDVDFDTIDGSLNANGIGKPDCCMSASSDGEPFSGTHLRPISNVDKHSTVHEQSHNGATVPSSDDIAGQLPAENHDHTSWSTSIRIWCKNSLPYAVPSFLYMLDNNLMYLILQFITPATQQLLWNIKIVWTAILFRTVLKRNFTRLQWVSLILLLVGVVTTQSSKFIGGANVTTHDHEKLKLLTGICLVILGSLISSLAGVYTEWVLKSKSSGNDFWSRNINLYVYGTLFNLIALIARDWKFISTSGLFANYNIFTVLLLVDTTLNGLSTAGIYRFIDSIAAVYAHVTAMLVVVCVSVWLFAFSINLVVFCGFCTCIISIWLYHHDPMSDPIYRAKQQVVK